MAGEGDILIVIPPFGSVDHISLGPHILQGLAKKHGYQVDLLYLNILFASTIGVEYYDQINDTPNFWMLCERLFARSAYDLPVLGKNSESCGDEAQATAENPGKIRNLREQRPFERESYLELEQTCYDFIHKASSIVASLGYKAVGCSAGMTRQTNASIAFLQGIKKNSPNTVTLLGGDNCKGEMAAGMASLSSAVDHVFSDESEQTFLRFLRQLTEKDLPEQQLIPGEPLNNFDQLPLPDYEIYTRQYSYFLETEDLSKTNIWYETSRGCWWAQKVTCTFCNEYHTSHRQKSVPRVVEDLKKIKQLFPDKMLLLTDLMIPRSYYKQLLPAISHQEVFPELGCQVRAEHSLEELVLLKKAKIKAVLPGIESFSTNLLKLMNKGIKARQGLYFLRNVMCVGIYTDWLMLWGFPGDHISDYEEILELLPLLRHLQPPRVFNPLLLSFSSPYFEDLEGHQISNLRPWKIFDQIYPDWADKEKLTIFYTGDFPSESLENLGLIRKIDEAVNRWKEDWKQSKLAMVFFMGSYLISDDRGLFEREKTHVLNQRQAQKIMISQKYDHSESLGWAVQEKLGVILDAWYVPLVTASPELLSDLEKG